LVPGIGGHNFLEPIKFSCNVATGEYIANFTDIYEHVSQFCKQLRNADEIAHFVLDSFENFARRDRVAQTMEYETKWAEVVRQVL
jgi:3-deoxy-D-manno-octulosonic-acid transferase